MSDRTLWENIEKHGSSGRYVHLLEQELTKRASRRRLLITSLLLNCGLLVAIILLARP